MSFVDLYKKFSTEENFELKERIFKNSPFDLDATEKIWEKYFKYTPLKLNLLLKKYDLSVKKVLDVGSAWGEFLIHFGPRSKGVEVLPESIKFSKAIGLEVEEYNFEDEWRETPESFDAVWCSNVLEHIVAPHRLLRRFHGALKKDGLVFIRVPTIPSNWFFIKLNKLFLGFLGYEALQHINAFTRRTIEFAVERAGFQIIESGNFLPFLQDALSFTTVVARKIPFEYPEKRPDIQNPKWLDK